MAEYRKVASVGDIPEGGMKTCRVDHDQIVICRSGGKYYAVADECSHDAAPISTGHLRNHEIVCPRHGARFDITSGAVTGPPAVSPIDTFEIKIENDDIYILFE